MYVYMHVYVSLQMSAVGEKGWARDGCREREGHTRGVISLALHTHTHSKHN
jgi:hypothetical protein